jgi:hypothetical protein
MLKSTFLASFPCFEKIKVGLLVHLLVCVCVCVFVFVSFPIINFWMPKPIFIKLRLYINSQDKTLVSNNQ